MNGTSHAQRGAARRWVPSGCGLVKGVYPETAPSALPASSSWDKAARGNRCRRSGTLLPWAVPRARLSGDSLHDKAPAGAGDRIAVSPWSQTIGLSGAIV